MDRFARYCWATLAFTVVVVLGGALVRATGSGAGCGSHWPLCNGQILPSTDNAKTLIELSHRLTSGLLLLLAVGAFRFRPKGHAVRKAALVSLVFLLGEAAVGAGLVHFELVAGNQSMTRALVMAIHLINTFFLLAALTLTAWFASGGAPFRVRGQGAFGGGLLLGAASLILAGVSGAIAALGDTLFPSLTLAEALARDLSPTAHALIRLRVWHPVISTSAGLLALILALQLGKRGLFDKATGRLARCVAVLVGVQIAVGVVNVLLLAPVWMQIVHLLLADLLWIAFVLMGASVLAVAESAEGAAAPLAVPESLGTGGGLAAGQRQGS